MKIKRVNIVGLRGVRNDLDIIVDKSESILIYGDNGTGKSSITDALEWFYYDKVEHLSTEEIGARGLNGLRNIFLADAEDAYIDLEYSDRTYNSRKRIFFKKDKLQNEHSNSIHHFKKYLESSVKENLILRYRDLLRFILSTKTEKLREISEIIGFAEVTRIKDVLKKAVNEVKKELKIKDFDGHINSKQAQILALISHNITSDEQYFKSINKLVQPLELKIEVKDDADVESVLERIKKPEDKETILLQASYEKVIEKLNSIRSYIEKIDSSYDNFHNKYQKLVADKEIYKKISLEKLLSEGLSILETRIFEDNKCPLCLVEKQREQLIDELKKRIEELTVYKKEKEAVLDDKDTVLKYVESVKPEAESIVKERCLLLKETSEIKKELENVVKTVSNAITEIKSLHILETDIIKEPDEFLFIDPATIEEIISILTSKKDNIATEKKDDLSFSIYGKIFSLKHTYNEIKSFKVALDVLTQQQRSLELLYSEFINKQRAGLSQFMESISKDINDFYLFMNDSENVSGIELIPLDAEDEFVGLTIEFKFYGKTDSPPSKYLSESHLNCLGICLFLASVKTFNNSNKFIVLDDVISSFDKSHRARFARLLTEKFSDYQIFLFTHEKEWFELLSNMVKGNNWKIKRIQWDSKKGPDLLIPLFDLRERIDKKIEESNSLELGNMIRKYLERLLKDICYECEVKVKYLFNEQNENRMSNELLSELKRKLKDRDCEIKDEQVFNRLNASMFIGNRTSHDSTFFENIADLKMFYGDVLELEKIFRCNKCQKIISKKHYDSNNKKIKCSCGSLQYSWNR